MAKLLADNISLRDAVQILMQHFGETRIQARLMELYFNTAGFEGYMANYIHGTFEGTLQQLIVKLRDEWIPNLKRGNPHCDKYGVYITGLLRKKWNIDLKLSGGFGTGSWNYYVDIKPLEKIRMIARDKITSFIETL